MKSQLAALSTFGKPITLDDQGVYYVLNKHSGTIQNVIQLVYEDDDWFMYELQKTSIEDEYLWTVLADTQQLALQSMTSEQIAYYLAKPDYAQLSGAWQMMRNQRYGFGKFTPQVSPNQMEYAFLVFEADHLQAVIRLRKAVLDQHQTNPVQERKRHLELV